MDLEVEKFLVWLEQNEVRAIVSLGWIQINEYSSLLLLICVN